MHSAQVSDSTFPGEMLTREIFGNISSDSKLAFYVLTALSLAVFCYGVRSRWRLWKLGRKEAGNVSVAASLRQFAAKVLTQRAVRGRDPEGVHAVEAAAAVLKLEPHEAPSPRLYVSDITQAQVEALIPATGGDGPILAVGPGVERLAEEAREAAKAANEAAKEEKEAFSKTL